MALVHDASSVSSLSSLSSLSSPSSLSSRQLVPWGLALAAFGAAVLAIGAWPVGVFQDDGIYAVLAKSLATGQGYRYLNLPGTPPATHYPPAYPLLLAVLWKVYPQFPQNVTLFKFANALLLGGAAVLFHRLACRHLGMGVRSAALSVLLFSACAPVVLLTVMVLSEPMFLCALAAVLLASERAVASGRVRDAAVAGAAAAGLAMVRTLGIVVVPATCLVLAARRQWRSAFVLGGTAVVLSLPWQLWVSAHAADVPPVYLGKYGSYLGWLVDAVRSDGAGFLRDVAWANLKSLVAQGWASTATDTLPAVVRNSASIALAFFFGVGMGVLARRGPVVALFLAFYLAIVVIWPFAPARFTWGVWPLVGVVYGLAVVAVWEWGKARAAGAKEVVDVVEVVDAMEAAEAKMRGAPPKVTMPPLADPTIILPLRPHALSRIHRALRVAALASLAALLVGYAGYNVLGVTRDWWGVVQGSVANRARPLAEWVMANTDSNAVVATDDDVLIHLYTGRKAIPNGAFTPQEHLVSQSPEFATASLRTILDTYHVDYVLASTQYGTYAVRGLVQARPPRLRVVRVLSSGAVFAPVSMPEAGR